MKKNVVKNIIGLVILIALAFGIYNEYKKSEYNSKETDKNFVKSLTNFVDGKKIEVDNIDKDANYRDLTNNYISIYLNRANEIYEKLDNKYQISDQEYMDINFLASDYRNFASKEKIRDSLRKLDKKKSYHEDFMSENNRNFEQLALNTRNLAVNRNLNKQAVEKSINKMANDLQKGYDAEMNLMNSQILIFEYVDNLNYLPKVDTVKVNEQYIKFENDEDLSKFQNLELNINNATKIYVSNADSNINKFESIKEND